MKYLVINKVVEIKKGFNLYFDRMEKINGFTYFYKKPFIKAIFSIDRDIKLLHTFSHVFNSIPDEKYVYFKLE